MKEIVRLHVVHPQTPAEDIDDTYPLYLTTGRVLSQYQSGTQTRRISQLNEIIPEPLMEIHPNTAQRLAERLTLSNSEALYLGSKISTKLKVMGIELAVSGCPRNCAESTTKDIGIVAIGEPVENACQGLKVYTVRVEDNGDVLLALD